MTKKQLIALLKASDPQDCPFCAGGAILRENEYAGHHDRWVECSTRECSFSGPLKPSGSEAIAAWNSIKISND